jgi:carboxylesterase
MEPATFKRTEINPSIRAGALLLHGLTGMPAEMQPLAEKLQAAGLKTSSPLAPGHGAGHKEMLATGWQDWVTAGQRAFDELAEDCDKVVIVGLSMGAILGIILASRNKKAAGLGLLSPAIKFDGKGSKQLHVVLRVMDFVPVVGKWVSWIEQPPYGLKDEKLQKEIAQQLELTGKTEASSHGTFRTYAHSMKELELMVKYCRSAAPHVRCPALVLHSLEDSFTSEANAVEAYRMIGSRDKRMVLLTGCDHMLTVDLRKDDVAKQVLQLAIDASYYEPGPTALKTEDFPSPISS